MKSLKSYLLVVLFAFSCTMNFVYAADGDEFTVDDATYLVTEEGYHKCELTEYTGEVENLVLPSTVSFEKKNYNIVGIGFDAFNLNASLVTVELPATVDYIGPSAFSDCYNLTTINLQNVTIIGDDAFANDHSLTGVVFGKKLKSIGARTFMSCFDITSIKIPHSVTSISEGAFQGCKSLTEVYFGSSIEMIGDTAFTFCSSLQTVVCYATTPPQIGENTFDKKVTQKAILYIPEGTKDAYVESLWGKFFAFKNIIEKDQLPALSTDQATTPTKTSTATTKTTTTKTSTKTSTQQVAQKKKTGEIKVSQKGNVVSVTLPEGASIEVYDEQNVLLETVKMIDGALYNE